MNNIIKITSPNDKSSVAIEAGELVSYQKFGQEFIHQKGDKGWSRSDIEMLPIIGPVTLNNYKVITRQGTGIQDQHGHLRLLDYELIDSTDNKALFQKKYVKNIMVKNAKFPKKSKAEYLSWPYDFTFKKTFTLTDTVLKVEFEIHSEKGMPFMLGYHPAFKIYGNNSYIQVAAKRVSLQDVLDCGSNAYPVIDIDTITLFTKRNEGVNIKTQGFNNFMIWTEVNNMICIEPITQYTDLARQNYSEKNMRISNGVEKFEVALEPFKDLL